MGSSSVRLKATMLEDGGRVPAGGVGYEVSAAGRTRAFDIAL